MKGSGLLGVQEVNGKGNPAPRESVQPGRSLDHTHGDPSSVACEAESTSSPKGDVDQPNEYRHLNERTNRSSQRFA